MKQEGVVQVNRLLEKIQGATDALLSEPVTLLILLGFVVWAGVFDFKHLKITNRLNQVFLATGLALMLVHFLENHLGLPTWIPSLAFGWSNIGGLIAGFLFLFIPGFIKGHSMGGDIKHVTVLGFWIGFDPLLLVLIVATVGNALYWYGAFNVWKEFGKNTLMPFAPFFGLGLAVVFGIGYFV